MNKSARALVILTFTILICLIGFKILEIDNIIMKKMYPLKYRELVEKYSKQYNIDQYMVYAIIKTESNFNSDAESSKKAFGLMQIMENTAIETANKMDINFKKEDLFDPDININIGLNYFSRLLDKYNNNYNLAIIAYNAGIGNVDKWIKDGTIEEDGENIENVPFKETNNYVRKILRNYEIYKEIYEK